MANGAATDEAMRDGLADAPDQPERVTPDSVKPPTEQSAEQSTDVERAGALPDTVRSPHEAAIDRAAQHAIDNPGVPGRDEFLALAAQARMISLSGAAPEAVRNNPHLAFHIAMVGRDLGISPSAAIELIDVIPGRGGPRLSLSPQLLNGQVRRLGLGEIIPVERTNERCVAAAIGSRGLDPSCGWPVKRHEHVDGCRCDVLGLTEFTWDDARIANLVGQECKPGDHKTHGNDRRCGCNQGYITYPKRMLWWRASGFATDDYFPEAGLGLYTAEELGAVVDPDGRPIDPATLELPPGYDTPATRAATERASQQAAQDAPAPAEDLERLRARIADLSRYNGAVDRLKGLWQQRESEDAPPRLPPLDQLATGHLRIASALIDTIERLAGKGEFGEPTGDAAPPPADDAPEGDDAGHVDASDESPPPVHSDGPEPVSGSQAPESGQRDAAPQPGPPPPVVVLPFDPDGLPAENTPNADLRWLARAPEDLTDEVAAEMKALATAEVDSRLQAAQLPVTGKVDSRRARLAARVVRLRMERMMHPTLPVDE